MTNNVNASVGCLQVAEYVDQGECPTNLTYHRSEVVRPQVVANYLDQWERDEGTKSLTVLLKDGRVLAVRGHGLKHQPHPQGGQDVYKVVLQTGGEEVLVALFNSLDVSGIFCGEVRSDRKIA